MRSEVVRIPVADGSAERAAKAIREARVDGYLAPPHCVGTRVLISETGSEVLVVVDWASEQAHAEAADSAPAGAFFAAVEKVAVGPPDVHWYEPA